MNEIERRALLGAAGFGAVAAWAKAGPLEPPAGPVAPSGRTLDEVYNKVAAAGAADGRVPIAGGASSVTIAAAGSYVLTGNLAGALTITASNVTVDLNGYTISGGTAAACVQIDGSSVRVLNGRLRSAAYGVLCGGSRCEFTDLHISGASVAGVLLAVGTSASAVHRCVVIDTGGQAQTSPHHHGIYAQGNAHSVRDCVVHNVAPSIHSPSTPCYGIYVAGASTHLLRCSCSQTVTPAAGAGIRVSGGLLRGNTVSGWLTNYQLENAANAGENA